MKGIRRIRQRLCALLLALACLAGLAACGGPDFGSFSKELTFGDKQISDTQTTYVMKIPEGKLGDLIGPSQIQWVIDQYGDPPAHTGVVAVGTKKAAKDLLRKSPELQCRALENTYQEESSDEGKWEYKDSSCRKQRKLSWLEKTLWNMYQVQSDSTIEWLSTSRNTLVAANDTVSTLQANATPNYDSWFAPVNRYLRIAQGVLVAAAAISLIVLSARIVWNIGQGGEGRLLDRIGWILLGVLLGSSCASIALTFFSRSSGGNPDLPSWTPGGGTTFFLSDYIRMQVDPFLIIAAVCGVIAAGWKLVTQQEGRDLIPLGKAFMWAILSAVCLAGLVNTFQATFDTWTADVLRSASGMMNDAWESKSLAASSFFNLGAPVAIVLTIVMWICGLISKIFAYFRAGMLPILVGVAPMWAAMSWMETGKQAFAKTIGWLAAFLAYKPVAALVMATGSAIMATAGPGDDSQAITLMLTLSVIILLPAMIRVIVPAVQSSVGGGGGGILPSILGMGVAVAGGGLRKAMGGKGGRKGGDSGGGEASPDGAKPGAGRGLAGLLSGLGRNGGKPQGANGGGKHAKPLDGNPTGGEPQNIGDKPQGANRKGNGGKPQGANGNGAGSPVPPAPDGADSYVASWSGLMESLASEAGVTQLAVTVDTAPDSGVRFRRTLSKRIVEDAPELAARAMAQIMDQYAAGGASNDVTLTLTFRYTDRDGKYLEAGEAARRISLLLPSIREQIAQAGGGAARALGMEEITRMVRVAYDPAAQETIEESDEPPYIAWEDCGPLMHEAGWSHYSHDSGLSRTWEMVDPPKSNVTADTLTRLLSPLADCGRKRVTVLYRMLPPDKTMFMAEQNRQKAANQVSQEKRATVRSMSQIGKANRQAVATNQGAVMVFFGMLVTVTVSRGEQESQRLEAASRAVEQAAGGAKIDLRPCYGAQDTGFAASLPLGLNVRSYAPAGPLGRLLS